MKLSYFNKAALPDASQKKLPGMNLSQLILALIAFFRTSTACKLIVAPFILVFFISCVKNSSDYKNLQARNDSLQMAKEKLEHEVDDYFNSLNEIEQNIEKIKETEGAIEIKPAGQETEDTRSKISEDIQYLNELIQNNKDELANLKSRLKKSAFRSNKLEQNIARLTKMLEDESLKVSELQNQLAQKDSIISQLGSKVDNMGHDIENLKSDNESKQSKIKEQEEAIHSAWYVFGTRKELKEQKIITSDGIFRPEKVLQGDFNRNYFVKIDARNTKSIPLYSARAKILTTHPKSSYTLEKENGNFVLLITDPGEFWSISKYLVIEVD